MLRRAALTPRGFDLADIVASDRRRRGRTRYFTRAGSRPQRAHPPPAPLFRPVTPAKPRRRTRHRHVPGCRGMMNVAIVDYGSGNLHSAHKALERAARESGSEREIASPAILKIFARRTHRAARRRCLCRLQARSRPVDGMVEALNEAVVGKGRPFLGICVGMQLMATRGLEHQSPKGLAGCRAMSSRSSPPIPA